MTKELIFFKGAFQDGKAPLKKILKFSPSSGPSLALGAAEKKIPLLLLLSETMF